MDTQKAAPALNGSGVGALHVAIVGCQYETSGATRSALERLGCHCHDVPGPIELQDLLASRRLDGAILDIDYQSSVDWLTKSRSARGILAPDRVVCRVNKERSKIDELLRLAKAGVHDILLSRDDDDERLKSFVAHLQGTAASANEPFANAPDVGGAKNQELDRIIIGDSQEMRRIRATIEDVAGTKAAVLLYGERGTGKKLIAQTIHSVSAVAQGPFVPVNMASLPEAIAEALLFGHESGALNGVEKHIGYCGLADSGTLFLDEISEMGLQIQPQLLRFVQTGTISSNGEHRTRKVDTRIITATERHPATLVDDGKLREDLCFRLNVVPIHVPPLRQRVEDIGQLAQFFLERFAVRHDRAVESFSREALDCLQSYPWPGNVRQLENVVERIVIFAKAPIVGSHDLPRGFDESSAFMAGINVGLRGEPRTADSTSRTLVLKPIQQKERAAIVESLQQTGGHVVDAANLLGLSQATMYRKIKEYQIVRERKRRKPSLK